MNDKTAVTFLNEMGMVSPWMNAAGFLSYLPPSRMEFEVELGAFVPPPLTFTPRTPAENRTLISYPGGFLLHNAIPNPGLQAAVKQYGNRWAKLHLPVWLHLFVENEEEAVQMSAIADDLENVQVVEIELPVRISNRARFSILDAARGEKPLIAALPLNEVDREFVIGCAENRVSAVVISAPRGRMANNGSWVNGRLFGPSLLPQLMLTLERCRKIELPLIAGCGIYSVQDGEILLRAGAAALQVDAALWI
jgi:dihydroorotate dehydrogenase